MFEVPGAKRVRRNELYSSNPSSREHSPEHDEAEAEAKLQAHFASIYGNLTRSPAKIAYLPPSQTAKHNALKQNAAESLEVVEDDKDNEEGNNFAKEEEEQAYEFRLFSAPSRTAADTTKSVTQKIILEADHEEVNILGETIIQGDGAFSSQGKDPRIWTRVKATGDALARLQYAAVGGEDVLRESQRRNWGLEVPWRVRVIKQKMVSANGLDQKHTIIATDESQRKRRKPGKKRRIVLRMRVQKLEEQKSKKEAESKEKEEADKERQTRKNREKKLKQKARAKAKAEAAKQTDDTNGVSGDVGMTNT